MVGIVHVLAPRQSARCRGTRPVLVVLADPVCTKSHVSWRKRLFCVMLVLGSGFSDVHTCRLFMLPVSYLRLLFSASALHGVSLHSARLKQHAPDHMMQVHHTVVRLQQLQVCENFFLGVVALDTVALVSEYSTMPSTYRLVLDMVCYLTRFLFLHACMIVRPPTTSILSLLYIVACVDNRVKFRYTQVHLLAAVLYFVELLMKFVAYGVHMLSGNSKKFDSVVVMLSTVDGAMCLGAMLAHGIGTQPSRSLHVLRSLRVLHVLKFFRYAL